METATHEEQRPAAVRKTKRTEPRMRWSCLMPTRVVEAMQRYSDESGIPQATIVRKATEKALREVGAL